VDKKIDEYPDIVKSVLVDALDRWQLEMDEPRFIAYLC
jgi:hypothetical protein